MLNEGILSILINKKDRTQRFHPSIFCGLLLNPSHRSGQSDRKKIGVVSYEVGFKLFVESVDNKLNVSGSFSIKLAAPAEDLKPLFF